MKRRPRDLLIIDPRNGLRIVWRARVIQLQPKRLALLSLLASGPGEVFSDDEVYLHLWGDVVTVNDNAIAGHVSALRAVGLPILRECKTGYRLDLGQDDVMVIRSPRSVRVRPL